MAVYNVHERLLPVPAHEAGALIDGLAGPDDRLWPGTDWPPLTLDRALGEGAYGGHGPVRYGVAGYAPGQWVRFRFSAPRGFLGFHEFTVHPLPYGQEGRSGPPASPGPQGPSGVVLRHTLAMHVRGAARLSWPLFFRWCHDAVLEDAMDRAERACTGTVAAPACWSPYVRLLRRVIPA
ncbi:SRPBCC family protein [Streptomyces armeniacus]|uniref:SRPBCC family protein n=1 Tax=Streptomyces armeniacus TaxID=83291 RepID=A0A345XXA0_9ACTN|nr:SRPBCC family protein [Streptomyces armeniacus]AXK36266.1 SRPBCC family protein [Streptomyces armeniacus]